MLVSTWGDLNSHVALLDVIVRVLVGAVRLAALAKVAEEAADGHAGLVKLVEEPARLALHAQAPQPVPAHRLPVSPAATSPAVPRPVRSPTAADRAGVKRRRRMGTCRRGRVEAALEVEAEAAVAVVHGEMLGFGNLRETREGGGRRQE
jgi:hypothetical protein